MTVPYQLWRSPRVVRAPEVSDVKKCEVNFTFSLAGELDAGYGVPDLLGG
jgi:hypothetical protein